MGTRTEYELFRRGNAETGRYHEINIGRGDRPTVELSDTVTEKQCLDYLWGLAERLGGDYEYAIKQTTTTTKTEWIDC